MLTILTGQPEKETILAAVAIVGGFMRYRNQEIFCQ